MEYQWQEFEYRLKKKKKKKKKKGKNRKTGVRYRKMMVARFKIFVKSKVQLVLMCQTKF